MDKQSRKHSLEFKAQVASDTARGVKAMIKPAQNPS